MTYPRIIGLSGVARAGKDTVGQILHDLYGYQIVSFSDILNRALVALNPWVPVPVPGQSPRTSLVPYARLIEDLGYEAAKEFPEVRRLLQAMGTEVGRDLLGQDIWVEALFKNLDGGPVVITNVRFPNEYDAVKKRGGEVWRVVRPGFEASNGHISDTALDGHVFDEYLLNDSSVRALADRVMSTMDGPDSVNQAHNLGARA